jgi:aldehyde:ferredoxin oxidoreductase
MTAIRPEDVLPDGVDTMAVGATTVRKGTVAAFVANANILEQLPIGDLRRNDVEAELRALAPALHSVGVLDVFAPRSAEIAAILGEAPSSCP